MSFLNCLQGKVDSKLLKPSDMKRLEALYEKHVKMYNKTMGSAEAVNQAAADVVNKEMRRIKQKKLATYKHVQRMSSIIPEIESKMDLIPDVGALGALATPLKKLGLLKEFGQRTKADKFAIALQDTLENTDIRAKSIRKQFYANLDEFADKYGSKWGGIVSDRDGIKDVVRSMMGEAVENADSKAFGDSLRDAFELAYQRFRASGGVLGKLDNWFPQVHKRQLLLDAGLEDWKKFITPLLDRDRMINQRTGLPFTDSELSEALDSVFENVTTNGKTQMQKRLDDGLVSGGTRGTELAAKRDASRFIHFKNADFFLEYNDKFGLGEHGLFDAMTGHLDSMARDIANMEILGPKPNAMQRFLNTHMDAKGVSKVRKGWINGMFDVALGKLSGDESDVNAGILFLENTQNVMRSAYLGGASISAISDSTFISATASLSGMSSTKMLARYAGLLNPSSSIDRQIAKRSGYIADMVSGSAMSDMRFTDSNMGGHVTRKLAEFTNRASGLEAMTNAAKHAVALEFEATLADLAGSNVAWKSLDNNFREMLQKFNITEADWKIIKKSPIFEAPENGSKFLRSQDVLKSTAKMTTALEKNQGKMLRVDSDELIKIANKIDDVNYHLQNLATNEAGLRTRAITTGAALGDASRGTALRAFSSSVFMFKTFPITVLFNHIIPMMQSASIGKFNHMAQVAVGTTLLGAAAMQVKEVVKGRTPKEMDDYKFWQAAALQGGGLGLFGDFLFNEYSRFGRDPIFEFMGPVFGLASDTARVFKGNLERGLDDKEGRFMKDLFNLAKRNTPAVNLWYSRLAVERLLLDNIERMVDPKFDKRVRRMERKAAKEGQAYWWGKGDVVPN